MRTLYTLSKAIAGYAYSLTVSVVSHSFRRMSRLQVSFRRTQFSCNLTWYLSRLSLRFMIRFSCSHGAFIRLNFWIFCRFCSPLHVATSPNINLYTDLVPNVILTPMSEVETSSSQLCDAAVCGRHSNKKDPAQIKKWFTNDFTSELPSVFRPFNWIH